MANIKVAVRIRPLSQRELLRGEEVVVRKENKFVLVTNPKIPEKQDGDSRHRVRRFAVDFCYDSKDSEDYNQEAVYKEIGLEVLHSMFEGFNACILAYGHSASGKTYTIMGVQDDPGLTPRLCQGLFDKLNEKRSDERIRFQVFISFLEIYNEKVRDLLGSKELGATSGNFSLRVREHPKLGPYVQGLSQHLVTDKTTLLGLLARGNKRRSTAATENNTHSSRSHAVFTIQFKQSDGENFETEKSSKVYFVDLAGSERANSSQNKARLKEGANINKSLVTLGNVISVLAESRESETFLNKQCGSKTWHPFVPYRDSILTWLLKDTLGGNSNTIMIATISPASGSLNETVNTLRYAKRTKRIVNQPMVNEDPKVRTIRQLKKEIAQLKRLLLSFHSCENWHEFEDSYFESKILIPSSKRNRLDSEGKIIAVKEFNENKKGNLKKNLVDKEEAKVENKINEDDGKKNKVENIISTTLNEYQKGVLEQRAAPSGSDACKINDEKKSDVNGSIKDIFSHESQIFSDSLESFSSVSLRSENSCDADAGVGADDDNPRLHRLTEYAWELGELTAENLRFCLMREFGSCENLPKKYLSAMLCRSRPDLIKGISVQSEERFLTKTSQSCTDLSNMSQGASENSLISSRSTDRQSSEKVHLRKLGKQNLQSPEAKEQKKISTVKKQQRNEIMPTSLRKKEKRSEIVNAVTSRLYVTKKKSERVREVSKKKDDSDEDEELEESKLCRRARMKLFDLSRKLAMTRRIKKTTDNDSQTDSVTSTLRLKEKGVTTDASGPSNCEGMGIFEESSKEEKKPCVIMNQVFIPKASNYVVKCGKIVRIEAPKMTARHETATQTSPENGNFENANTSPFKFCISDENCFSDDSLDYLDSSEDKDRSYDQMQRKIKNELKSDVYVNLKWLSDYGTYFPCESGMRFRKEFKIQNFSQNGNKLKEPLLDEMCLGTSKDEILPCKEMSFVPPYFSSSSVEESRKDDNPSSENSFTSAEGADISCSSEASSEDFVFYENFKEKDSATKNKATGDRELYTITENSEQSDPSDACSPVESQSQVSFLSVHTKDEKCKKSNKILKNAFGFEFTKDQFRMLDQPNETWTSYKSDGNNFETEIAKKESESERKYLSDQNDKVSNFTRTFNLIKSKPDKLKIPKDVTAPYSACENVDRVPKNFPTSNEEKELVTGGETKNKNLNPSDIQGCLENGKTRSNQTDWRNFESYSQKQYLNLNISSGSKVSPFSVDTHLFGKSSPKNQSMDTMFNSSDSITIVFMGPAKPKTSVLMEIIRRSLGKNTFSGEIFATEGKSRNRETHCDANLMRSVSIDTAIMALSRIAKNREPSTNIQKSSSLGTLSSNETPASFDQRKFQSQRESSCQCDFDVECFKNEREKRNALTKCSVSMSTSTDELDGNETTKNEIKEVEKQQKSVSWCGKSKHLGLKSKAFGKANELNISDFYISRKDPESKTKELNQDNFQPIFSKESGLAPERRVRFSKPETKLTENPEESLTLFLNEAIQVLKNINFCCAKHQIHPDKATEKIDIEDRREIKENKKKGLTNSDDSESFIISKTETSSEKGASRRSKMWSTFRADESHLNFTWPRRRPTVGKPPTGIKPKFSRLPLLSRSESSRSNNSLDLTTNWSPSNRVDLSGQSWKLSNFSVGFSNSCLGESQGRAPSSRSFGDETKWLGALNYQPNLLPRFQISKLNLDSLSELESELEESCRRLEMATAQDRTREKLLKSRKTASEWHRYEVEGCIGNENTEEEYKMKMRKEREIIKRRITEECLGTCTCKESKVYSCKYLWTKGCQSSFELDSFGPGSAHCHQLCMFCRKKNAEIYHSTLNLNSECISAGLCRLNFYGFCPCSSFRLSHIASSPRAYKQHLLALRKQIVGATKQQQLDFPG